MNLEDNQLVATRAAYDIAGALAKRNVTKMRYRTPKKQRLSGTAWSLFRLADLMCTVGKCEEAEGHLSQPQPIA